MIYTGQGCSQDRNNFKRRTSIAHRRRTYVFFNCEHSERKDTTNIIFTIFRSRLKYLARPIPKSKTSPSTNAKKSKSVQKNTSRPASSPIELETQVLIQNTSMRNTNILIHCWGKLERKKKKKVNSWNVSEVVFLFNFFFHLIFPSRCSIYQDQLEGSRLKYGFISPSLIKTDSFLSIYSSHSHPSH